MFFQVLPQVVVGPVTQDMLDLLALHQQLFRKAWELVRAWLARMIVYLCGDAYGHAV